MAVLFPFNHFLLSFWFFLGFWIIYQAFGAFCAVVNIDKPIASSVELVGVGGLVPALAPGAASPPTFNLLLRIDNGQICDQYREGGSVKVSYAGVPLAYGSIPSFRLGARKVFTVAVNATSEGAGVPGDLLRLMAAERRMGVAQLDIVMQLGWPGLESYSWSVDFMIPMGRGL
ncbi:hypothetical protein E2562_011543 [Oryza meyeriana var. granulata]|uniref:Late embryogenesis abundant protein LEA-2 subgroup domain-containing protein n=1 Tax=Oryza meyeriana var. granulata TaxID=110450 RepID=A0A6G1DWW6_9ORYZ|nr:hypothetical protein E2562_011543 [Oryza meyeriana var. granulata]